MIISLSHPLPSRYGVPIIYQVDTSIFEKRYATYCLACDFCNDMCCSYGVDVDLLHRDAIMRRAEALEAYTGVARESWFESKVIYDDEMPGGGSVRTRVEGRGCVFLEPNGRGCQIHSFCDSMGIDYHDLKSFVDCLFPLTVTDGVLCPANEVDDLTLVCVGRGPTLFEGLRAEIQYYFGSAAVDVLNKLGAG